MAQNDDSMMSQYSSFESLNSRRTPSEQVESLSGNTDKPAENSQEDDQNSTTNPSMAPRTPRMHLPHPVEEHESRPPSAAATTESLTEPSYAELPPDMPISLPTETPLTSKHTSESRYRTSVYGLTPNEDNDANEYLSEQGTIYTPVGTYTSSPIHVSEISPMNVPTGCREYVERKRLIDIDSQPDTPSPLRVNLMANLPISPIFTSADVFRRPSHLKKRIAHKADATTGSLAEMQAQAYCKELKKLIEYNSSSQKMLYVAQRKYFNEENEKLRAEWSKFSDWEAKCRADLDVENECLLSFRKELEAKANELEKRDREIEEARETLEKERVSFNTEKNEERAKVAQMRNNIRQNHMRRVGQDSKELIEEQAAKIKKLTEMLQSRDRTVSDLRVKLTREEKQRTTAEKSAENYKKVCSDLKAIRKKLIDSQRENTDLRIRLSQVRQRGTASAHNISAPTETLNSSRSSTGGRLNVSAMRSNLRAATSAENLANAETNRKRVHWSTTLNRSRSCNDLLPRQPFFTMPGSSTRNTFGDLVNTMYKYTSHGNEYTFQNGLQTVVVTELKCFCKTIKQNNGDITWVYRPAAEVVEVNYFAQSGTFEVWSPLKHRIHLFADKHFEVHYPNGNLTQCTPTGERYEMFVTNEEDDVGLPIRVFELYESDSCIRLSTVDEPVEVELPEKQSITCGDETVHFIRHPESLSINTADVKMRRMYETGWVKICFVKNNPPLQITICPMDGVLLVQHIMEVAGRKVKSVCYGFGKCSHVNVPVLVKEVIQL